jgi:hypothetical protein
MREPGVCIELKHSPVDQFHNLIVPSPEPLTNVCPLFIKSTELKEFLHIRQNLPFYPT